MHAISREEPLEIRMARWVLPMLKAVRAEGKNAVVVVDRRHYEAAQDAIKERDDTGRYLANAIVPDWCEGSDATFLCLVDAAGQPYGSHVCGRDDQLFDVWTANGSKPIKMGIPLDEALRLLLR